MRSRTIRIALLACILALALGAGACTGVQTQRGEPETAPSTVTTQPASGSEEAQPPAGEEGSGGEQPGAEPTGTP